MKDDIYSIVERLAILEGRIAPKTDNPIPESRQKKPVLFNNLKKTDEDFIPMVGGVDMAEDRMEEDILAKVKASLADYLKSANNGSGDRELISTPKKDLSLNKQHRQDRDLLPKTDMRLKDMEDCGLDEDPSQGPEGTASGSLIDPTYAESKEPAPIKTIHVPVGEEVGLSGGGGSVLVEIHGDERSGFHIQRAGKKMRRQFKTLDDCELALEMYMAHRQEQKPADDSADYIEEA